MYYIKGISLSKIVLSLIFFTQLIKVNPCLSNENDFIDLQNQRQHQKSGLIFNANYVDEIQGISVIDFTGNYDKSINGIYNSEARKAVLQEFYDNNNDVYDFIYIFTEFEYDTGGNSAFAVPLMNDVQGIGRPIFDNSALYSSENLQSIIDMSHMDIWSFSLANPSYDTLLGTMVHEFMHRWGIFIKYIDDQSQVSSRLLGSDDVHWSFFFNSNASLMYGSLWDEIQTGIFKTTNTRHSLSQLDLYLSGIVGKDSVSDTFVINNANSGNDTDFPPPIGTEIEGEGEVITIDDIISYEGERNPTHLNAQHNFNVKFILLKKAEDQIDSQSIAQLYVLQNEFQKRFFVETNGIGKIVFDTGNPETGGEDPEILSYDPILNTSFQIQPAIDFLTNSIQGDIWADKSVSKIRDTVTVIKAFQYIVDDYPSVQNILADSVLWLNNYEPLNNDEMVWMLSSGVLNNQKKQTLLNEVINNENSSGGWGFDSDILASPYGTALTINALDSTLGDNVDFSMQTIQFVTGNINLDDGFPYVSGGNSSLTSSLMLLKIIQKITSNSQLHNGLINYILSMKLPNNSFGDEVGTAHETALFVSIFDSIDINNAYQLQIDLAKSALDKMQSIDGSMQGSIYSTALAIQVFNNNNKPNLLFEEASISNNNVVSGENILLNYIVKNSGETDAENVDVSVFHSTIDVNNLINQSQINLIATDQIHAVELFIDTTDIVGDTDIIVVIDENNIINESNEDDNTFSVSITASEASQTPELVLNNELFQINPQQFNELPFQVNASVTVTNLSLMDLSAINISLYNNIQDGNQTLLESKMIDLTSLESQSINFNVVMTQANSDIELMFVIDPDNQIIEFNEDNNSLLATIKKIQSIDLAISQQDINVPNQAIIGMDHPISFSFNNNGTELTSQFNVRVYAEKDANSQLIFESMVNEMLGGEQLSRVFNWNPIAQGEHTLRFILDEENVQAESNENNNQVSTTVQVVSNSLTNLNINSEDLNFSPDPGLEGQDLQISLEVHNNSTIESGSFDISLYQKMDNGTPNILISNLTSNSIIGNSSEVIQWDILQTSLIGQQTLIAQIDPTNQLAEFNENDNIAFKDIYVISLADAQVSPGGIQLSPTIPNIGEAITVTVNVSNIGEQELNDLSVSLYTDKSQNSNPVLVETQSIVELLGGQSQEITYNFTYPNDNEVDTLTVIVDELNTIEEANELNNQASILVGNQDETLYVTERYFSPNNDGIKDHTKIVFNESMASNYSIQVLDNDTKVIKNFDPNLFVNTSFGDVIWDGLNNNGVIARDGQYSIQLLNQDSFVVAATVVTIDTNKTPIFESLVANNGYTVDLNCLGDVNNSEMKFSHDGKSLYLTDYKDLFGNDKHGFYNLKADGSEIKSALPSELSTFSNISYQLLKNGNIIFSTYKNGINYLYLKEHLGGQVTKIFTELSNTYPNIEVVENDFVIVKTVDNLLTKIYYDSNNLPENIDISSYDNPIHVMNNGLILSKRDSYNHNSLYFISNDFNQSPVLISSDLTENGINEIVDMVYLANDRSLFAFTKNQEIHAYKAQAGNLIHSFTLPKSQYHGFNTHNDMVVLNDNSTFSIFNTSGQQIHKSSKIFSIEDFTPHTQNINLVSILINSDTFLDVNFSDRIDSYMSHSVTGMTDNSDEKKIILFVYNTMYSIFETPPCDDSIYFCEGWTEYSEVEIIGVSTKVVIDYSDLTNIDESFNESYGTISSMQEGRSSFIKLYDYSTSWTTKDTNDNNTWIDENIYESNITSTYPWLNLSNNDTLKDSRIETFKSFLYDNPEKIIENSCSEDPDSKYLYYSRSNLYANLSLAHSQNAIEISAIAFDDNFEKYEIYWSTTDLPEQWNFIFESNNSPSDGDALLNWIPNNTGLFNIKLIAYDKAGNSIEDIEQIFISSNAADIRNLVVGPQYFSPNGDGIKDEINIQYDVVSSTDVLIDIQNQSGQTVKTYELEYLNPENSVSVIWDGRDQNGLLLTDGKYQVNVQGFKTDVYLDTQAILIDGLSMSYHKFPLVHELRYPEQRVLEKLSGLTDIQSYRFESFRPSNSQWIESLLLFNSNNISEIINGSFRLKTEDKAGNIGISPISINSIKYTISRIYKRTNTLDVIHEDLLADTQITQTFHPQITDWTNGNQLAYLFQVFSYNDIEQITFKTSYIDSLTGETVVNTKLVNSLMPNRTEDYLTDKYIDSNSNGNNIVDIQFLGTSLPVLMIELEKDDFPVTSELIHLEFHIKQVSHSEPEIIKSAIQFLPNGPGALYKLRKLSSISHESLSQNEIVALEDVTASVLLNPNLQYFWVYENSQLSISNDHLIVTELNGQSDLYSPDFISETNDYTSRLFILSADECLSYKNYQWTGQLNSGEFVVSNNLSIINDFCVEPDLRPQFYMGEFCSNSVPDNSIIKFNISTNAIDPQSNLVYLVELYKAVENGSDQLIYSDTSPDFSETSTGNLEYRTTYEYDTSELANGNHTFKLIMHDTTGKTVRNEQTIQIDAFAAVNQINSPQTNALICAASDGTGSVTININANVNVSSKYGYQFHSDLSNTNNVNYYQDYNDFSNLDTNSSTLIDDFRVFIPQYQGESNIILETFNASGASYCSSVSVNIDSLVDVNLTDSLPNVSKMHFVSPNTDDIQDQIKLVNIEAYENVDVELLLFDINNINTPLVTLLTQSLVANELSDFYWDGSINNTPVADGDYLIKMLITDDCGLVETKKYPITVDTATPVSEFISPLDAGMLSSIHRVVVNIDENHLIIGGEVVIDEITDRVLVEFLFNGIWNSIEIIDANFDAVVDHYEIHLDWNLTHLNPGVYPIRVTVIDLAGNSSVTQITPELVATQNLIWQYAIAPLYISPNSDGVQDNANIAFGLNIESIVRIEAFDTNMNSVKVLVDNQTFTDGLHQIIFNGTDGFDSVLPDGQYTIHLTAAESTNLSNSTILESVISIDNLAPQIQWLSPLDTFTKGEGLAQLELIEFHPQSFNVQNQRLQPIDVQNTLLNTNATGIFEILNLADLNETQYQLTASAKDLAGNTSNTILLYTIDKTAPEIELTAPANDTYIGGINTSVNVMGSIIDDNFDHYELSISENIDTPVWQSIHNAIDLQETQFSYPWSIPANEGEALLRLSAHDKAGWLVEQINHITIDKTAPIAQITQPINGSIIGENIEIIGSANDDNFDFYSLYYRVSSTDLWQLFYNNQNPTASGSLGFLPSNLASGNYDVRLLVQDKVGLVSESIINVDLDNEPPPKPLNLTRKVINQQVTLNWNNVNTADLSGYSVFRNSQQLNTQILTNNQYIDSSISDGDYVYYVVAVDNYGNISESSNQVSVTIDTSAPDVFILTPSNNQRVNKTLQIVGTAHSLLDFQHYNLLLREVSQSPPGVLINHSNIPLNNELLGQIDTTLLTQNLDHIIRLEASDQSGNVASTEVAFYVDNIAPAAPENLYMYYDDVYNSVDLDWDPNSENDLAGYLIYSNGIVISGNGDGAANVANAFTDVYYDIDNLPDGDYVFSIAAIDLTGNISELTTSIQISVNTREPDTLFVSPQPNIKFEQPILIEATSPDSDLAEIKFEYSTDNSTWQDLDTDFQAPYQTTVNPAALNLTFGNVYLRATAKDSGGQIDPTPAELIIEYADLTPPLIIENLVFDINGDDIILNWDANTEPDFQGYTLSRIYEETTTLLTNTPTTNNSYSDLNLAQGTYRYQIIASDNVGNESGIYETEDLMVFTIQLNQPYSPMLMPDANIQFMGNSDIITGVIESTLNNIGGIINDINPAADGSFISNQITLQEGLNTIISEQRLAPNHVSLSDQIQVELSPVPQIPTNFQVNSQGYINTLSWDSSTEAFAYLPYRNGVPIHPISQLDNGLDYSASSNEHSAGNVSNPDNQSNWSPSYSDVVDENDTYIEISFNQHRWITTANISWQDVPSHYALQYHSAVGWIDIANFDGNNQLVEQVTTDKPYLTDKARILIKNNNGAYQNISLGGFQLEHRLLNPQTIVELTEPDGNYSYQVSMINTYGFESELSNVIVANVGDTINPEPVTLTAQNTGLNDVILNWDASTSGDVVSYWLFRNNELIYSSVDENVFSYVDMGLTDGQYQYFIRAIDGAGNASENSNSVIITVQQQPLPAPVGLTIYPAFEGQALQLNWQHSQSNRWHHFNIYRSLTSGSGYAKIAETMDNQYEDNGLENGITYYYVLTTADEFNNESDYSIEVFATPSDSTVANMPVITAPTQSGQPISLDSIVTNIGGTADPDVFVDLYNNNIYQRTVMSTSDYSVNTIPVFEMVKLRTNKNGQWYAYSSFSGQFLVASWGSIEINSLDINVNDFIWNLQGSHIYAILADDNTGGMKLERFDYTLNTTETIFSVDNIQSAVPSPDETKILYQGEYTNPQTSVSNEGLWLFDVNDSTAIEVASQTTTNNNTIAWSDNGEYIAFINDNNGGELYVYQVSTQQLTLIDNDVSQSNSVQWSPNNTSLLYDKYNFDQKLFVYDTITVKSNQIPLFGGSYGLGRYSHDGNKIVYRNYCCDVYVYDFLTQSSNWIYSGFLNIDSLIWNSSEGIIFNDWQNIYNVSAPGSFVFQDVLLNSGVNQLHTIARNQSGVPSIESLPIIINTEVQDLPDLVLTSENLIISPASAIQGANFIASAEINNLSQQAIIGAEILILLTKPDGSTQVIENPQSSINLQAQESQSIFIDLGTPQLQGEHVLQVIVDPQNNIIESNENNNSAYQTFIVLENLDPILQTFVLPEIAAPNQNISINTQVYNPSGAFNGSIELSIEDQNGFPVIDQQTFSITELLNNSTFSVDYEWDTNGIFAGNYQIYTSLIQSNGIQISQQSNQIEIKSFAEFDLSMELDQSIIPLGANIDFATDILFTQGNVAQQGTVSWEIFDNTQQIIWTKESILPQMTPGFNTIINNQWSPIGIGQYQIKAELITDVSQKTVYLPFEVINNSNNIEIKGTISALPTNIILGNAYTINYQLENTGSIDLDNIPVTLKIFNQDLSSTLISDTSIVSMSANQILDLNATFSSGVLISDVYLIALYADLTSIGASEEQLLDTRSISAIDTNGPEININQPLVNSINPENFTLIFTVTDQDSEVSHIHLLGSDINQGEPLDFNVNSRSNIYHYSLFGLTSGNHEITITATDSFGNTSNEIIAFIVDPVAPIINITGVSDGSFYNTPVTSNVVISDENLLTSEVFLNNQSIPLTHQIINEGSYFMSVRAEDAATNRSAETLFFGMDLTDPEIVVTYPQNNSVISDFETTVMGTTEALSSVIINVGSYQATTQSNTAGEFTFSGVQLQEGNNTIEIDATDRADNVAQTIQINVVVSQQSDIHATLVLATEYPVEDNLVVNYELQNQSNLDQIGLPVKIDLLKQNSGLLVATQTENIDLLDSQTNNESMTIINTGWVPGLYQLNLSIFFNNQWQLKSTSIIQLIDTTVPNIDVNSPILNQVYNSQILASLNATDLISFINNAEYEIDGDDNWLPMVQVNSSQFTAILQLENGPHSIKYAVIDSSNNRSETTSIGFAVDTISPVIQINNPSNGHITNQNVTIDFNVSDDHQFNVSSTLNGTDISSGGVIIQEGHYTLEIIATDEVNNQADQSIEFIIDKTNPTITLTNLIENQQFIVDEINITGLTEPHSQVSLSYASNHLEVTSNSSGEFIFKNVILETGSNQLIFNATDQANNISPTETITVHYNNVDVCSVFGFKSTTPYNVMVFEDYMAQAAHVQGRLAAGHNIQLNNYFVGEQLQASTAGNVLISGADIDFNHGQVYFGNILAAGEINLSQDVIDNMHTNAQIIDHAQLPIDFEQSYNEMKLFSNALAEQTTNSTHAITNNNLHLTGDCQADMQTYHISSADLKQVQNVSYQCLSQDGYMVLNIAGEMVELSHINLALLDSIKQRIIWNFNQSETLFIHHVNVPGSILATDVHIDNDILFGNGFESGVNDPNTYGTINGHLIAKSFNSKTRINLSAMTCNDSIQLNAKPIAADQYLQTPQNTDIAIDLNVIDENPMSLQYQLISSVSSGQLLGSMPNLTYVPETGYIGHDFFTYQVTDQFGKTSQATINIEVTDDVIFENGFEMITQSLSLLNTISLTGLLTQIILWRRK